MKSKKDVKEAANGNNSGINSGAADIKSGADLKAFLKEIRDRMNEVKSPSIVAMSAVNHVLNRPDIAQLLDAESKEIARDIWLRIKQAGLQVRNPPILFENGADVGAG